MVAGGPGSGVPWEASLPCRPMAGTPEITLHAVPFSHPVLAVSAALEHHGFAYERVELTLGRQAEEVERIYGEGRRTVPGLMVDGEPVHGTQAIFARLDEMTGGEALYPPAIAETVRAAEAGVAEDLQSAARVLSWGGLHFRPEALGTFPGGEPLDPAGTDYAIKMVRGAWKYIGIDAQQIAATLDALPGQLDQVDELIASGAAGSSEPTALDFQIGSTLQLLLQIGDVRPLIEGRPAERLMTAWFKPGPADIPAGAFPAGWVPAAGA